MKRFLISCFISRALDLIMSRAIEAIEVTLHRESVGSSNNNNSDNKQKLFFFELSHYEESLLLPFLEYSIKQIVDASNCIDDILLTFTQTVQDVDVLSKNNVFIFRRSFVVESVYTMNTRLECRYTAFNLENVCFHNDPYKRFIRDNSKVYKDILIKRGLEPHISNLFINALINVRLNSDCLGALCTKLEHDVNIDLIRSVFLKGIIKDGESPIRTLNGISERQQQKNLNLKRPKVNKDNDANNKRLCINNNAVAIAPAKATTALNTFNETTTTANENPLLSPLPISPIAKEAVDAQNIIATIPSNVKDDEFGPLIFKDFNAIQLTQFYLHTNNFAYFYYIHKKEILMPLFNNSKQYIQAFYYDSVKNNYLIITRDKKIENNCKKKVTLTGGNICDLPIPFSIESLELYQIGSMFMESDQWLLPFNGVHYQELNKSANKTITMNISPKYYEFRLLCKMTTLLKIIDCPAYKYFYVYDKKDIYCHLSKTNVQMFNVSFFVYYLDTPLFANEYLVDAFTTPPIVASAPASASASSSLVLSSPESLVLSRSLPSSAALPLSKASLPPPPPPPAPPVASPAPLSSSPPKFCEISKVSSLSFGPSTLFTTALSPTPSSPPSPPLPPLQQLEDDKERIIVDDKSENNNLFIRSECGDMQLGILYTTYTSNLTKQLTKSDNALRFLYLKNTNSLHPYPDTRENAELLNSLKIKIKMSELTNSKIEGSKHLHDGAMNAILSERGLHIVSEKKTHNKWCRHDDSRSCIFFNEPPLQNCQNPMLPVTFDTTIKE